MYTEDIRVHCTQRMWVCNAHRGYECAMCTEGMSVHEATVWLCVMKS